MAHSNGPGHHTPALLQTKPPGDMAVGLVHTKQIQAGWVNSFDPPSKLTQLKSWTTAPQPGQHLQISNLTVSWSFLSSTLEKTFPGSLCSEKP